MGSCVPWLPTFRLVGSAPAAPPLALLAGDFFFTRATPQTPWPWRLLAWAIGKGEREPGEAPSLATHKGGISKGGTLRAARASEAAWPHWREAPLVDLYGPGGPAAAQELSIWRLVDLTPEQREDLGRGYASHVGEDYNLVRIAAHGLDDALGWILNRPFRWFRKRAFLPQNICSTGIDQEVARVTKNDMPFGVPWIQAQPDDGLDWCLAHEGREVVRVGPRGDALFATLSLMLAAEAA